MGQTISFKVTAPPEEVAAVQTESAIEAGLLEKRKMMSNNANLARRKISDSYKVRLALQDLTFSEKRLIRETWHSLGKDSDPGNPESPSGQELFFRQVWLSAASRSPRIKEILGQSVSASDAEMWNSVRFQRLTRMVTDFFRKLIETHNLNTEKVLNDCMTLGVYHAQLKPRGFQVLY